MVERGDMAEREAGEAENWGHFVVAAPAPLLLRIVADFLFI